jgi:hypothetical protein
MNSARLAEYVFADLYLTGDPASPLLASALVMPEGDSQGRGEVLRALPETVRDDALALFHKLDAIWREARFLSEFSLVHDGITYRCSRIGPPNDAVDGPGAQIFAPLSTQAWCLRRIDAESRPLADLGLPDWLRAELRRLGGKGGLLIVTGPFASGKSTTAAACLCDWVEAHGGVGVTFEDPPERPIAGYRAGGPVFQIPVRNASFEQPVRIARRWAFRYALVGEIRSYETASETVQLALSGPTVVSTIHGSGPIEALMALSKFATAPDDVRGANDRIAAVVMGVLHQRLYQDRVETTYLSFAGRNAATMRTKIINGQFNLLADDLEYQTRLRHLGRASESL